MKKGDIILIISIIAICLASIYYIKFLLPSLNNNGEVYASIQIDGKEVKKLNFKDKEYIGKEIRFDSQYGYNIVLIEDKGIRTIKASCPDKTDVKMGYIDKPGEMIVCLPNRFIIEIKTDSGYTEIDAVN
ncbi:MAG: NusG domain II-containing protein [Tissierellia bacterium]|nr:NusG domain II-containing protein [Tissierellia bacterium]